MNTGDAATSIRHGRFAVGRVVSRGGRPSEARQANCCSSHDGSAAAACARYSWKDSNPRFSLKRLP